MTSPWVHKSSYITRINATSDASGKLIEILSYDQIGVKLGFWERSETKTLVEQIPSVKRIREGRRRNAQTWTYTNMPVSFGTTRGFTMHEHLDEFKLINMKSLPRKHDEGRVYDPLVGRFLSADPFIQQPDYSQSYNRYSYAFNNPLRFSDPSGFFAEGDSTLSPSRSLLHLPFLPAQRLSYRPGASTNTDNTSLGIVFKETETALPAPYLNSKLSRDAEGNAEMSPDGRSNSWAVTASVAYMTALKVDLLSPDFSDAMWAKWLGHAVIGTTSLIILYSAGKGNINYPGPWTYTYQHPSQSPLNTAPRGFDPNEPPFDIGKSAKWLVGGKLLYETYDEYRNHINKLPPIPIPAQIDNTYVAPRYYPYEPK